MDGDRLRSIALTLRYAIAGIGRQASTFCSFRFTQFTSTRQTSESSRC